MKIADLHASNWSGVCYLTGGGSLLISELLCEPGASATLLNAGIPYSYEALAQLLGHAPTQACSEVTARSIAMRAFTDAQKFETDSDLFGLGITASLSTNRSKRGQIRAYIALQTLSLTQVTLVEFPNANTRHEQEALLANVAYGKLCWGLGLTSDPFPTYTTQIATACASRQRLYGSEPIVLGVRSQAHLPGAFNPVHSGHRRMHGLAQEILGCEVQYELSIKNADKLPLDYFDLNQRIDQFGPGELVLTNLPYFYLKAKHLRRNQGVTFVVGIDTFARILEPKFYEGDVRLGDAIQYFVTSKTKFLVFGRTVENKFMTLDDLSVPESLLPQCRQVEHSQFQCDLASSTLRVGE